MEESILLGTKPLVDSICHFIWDPSGVFSVCHLCECRIVQWRHDSRLLLLLNWFLLIIKRTLHVGSKIWILCSRGKNIKFISSRHRAISAIYSMMAKPMKTLELHYPMIQFLINIIIPLVLRSRNTGKFFIKCLFTSAVHCLLSNHFFANLKRH